MAITFFNQNETPGYELLQKELKDLELAGLTCLSLNSFLDKHNLYTTKEDRKTLRNLLKDNKKWKLIRVVDYHVVRRGKRK